ncbi:MAG: TIGR02996 domain-containing protein, partial [Deltaproteobacteria bacterium]|nr:TIGR02996 domain-containing protein [Deltaproteobacteria bacterium]
MHGLTLVGTPRPVTSNALAHALGDRLAIVPGAYVELLERWGPGSLCGAFDLPDPTEPHGRFAVLQHRLRVEAPQCRSMGAWAQLADVDLERGVVLGVDRRGVAMLARSSTDVVLLHPEGHVLPCTTFEAVIAKVLLGGEWVKTYGALFTKWVRANWAAQLVRMWRRTDVGDLGVPAVHVAAGVAPRTDLFAAWRAGDETAADAALARVLATEVRVEAMLDLARMLAAPGYADVPRDVRATYVDQLYRMARRSLPELVPDLPIREIRIALASGELAPDVLATLEGLVEAPRGIFVGDADATELALLSALAAEPADAATRLVYADHLEEQGAIARAAALRTDAVAPLADAAARGFVAPANLEPIDG